MDVEAQASDSATMLFPSQTGSLNALSVGMLVSMNNQFRNVESLEHSGGQDTNVWPVRSASSKLGTEVNVYGAANSVEECNEKCNLGCHELDK